MKRASARWTAAAAMLLSVSGMSEGRAGDDNAKTEAYPMKIRIIVNGREATRRSRGILPP